MKESYFDADLDPQDSPLPEVHLKPEEEEPEAPAKEEKTGSKRQIMGYDLSTLAIAGSVLIALLVYAVWPDSPPQRGFVPDNSTAQPAQAQVDTPVSAPPVPQAVEPQPEAATQPEEIPEKSSLAVVNPLAVQEIIETNQKRINELDTLNGRVSDAERRLADIENRLKAIAASMAASANPVSKPAQTKRQPAKTASTHRTTVTRSGTVNRSKTGVQGWRVHTIYPGMAWITHGGTTWSVQAGDTINGMTVRSIDATARTVTTDRGVIRQGG